jgi:UDP-glucose 4-epimerase
MKIKQMSALVTGGVGFIGSHLSEALVRRGIHVTIVDNLSSSKIQNIREILDRIDLCELDICTPAFRDFLLRSEFDVIFHLAGIASVPLSVENPEYDFQTNLMATFQLLESLRYGASSPVLIVASSAAVYGNPVRVPILEADTTVPISPYGTSKLAVERYVATYSRLYGLRAASLRPFSAYGPRLRKQIVYDFIKRLSNDSGELVIQGDGSQIRDFIYVEDIVRAALVVLENGPLEGEVYNVACGRGYSTQEIANLICSLLGVNPKFRYTGNTSPGDPEQWIACIDKIRMLGFEPRISLEEGLSRTVEWFLSGQS